MLRQLSQPVLYPRTYGLYVALAALDILLTWVILSLGGAELNPFAALILHKHAVTGTVQITGATFFKFTTVAFVLVVCEFLGHNNNGELGKRLARWAVIISVIPVTVAIIELSDAGLLLRDRLARSAETSLPLQVNFDSAHAQ